MLGFFLNALDTTSSNSNRCWKRVITLPLRGFGENDSAVGAVDLGGGIVLTAGTTPDGRHDFLGGDFLLFPDSDEESFFESTVASLEGDTEPAVAEEDGVDSLFEALSAALLYPSLR